MVQPSEKTRELIGLAQEAIGTISSIAAEANNQLKAKKNPFSGDVFATPPTVLAHANLAKISFQEKESLKILATEPVIARIVATTDDGKEQVYYISRSTPISIPGSQAKFASYRAPIGRLAAIPVGDDIILEIGRGTQHFEVIKRCKLRPKFDGGGWDSRDNTVEDYQNVITIPSFRNLLAERSVETDPLDLLQMLLAEEDAEEPIIEGLRRGVIDRMQLRDQPILDQYQDEIFRLPLDSQLLLLGPPGTGKTTTLIRRLGQKLDVVFLSEEEQELLGYIQSMQSLSHEKSWVMFSPTDLLKLYIKEAFNREGIPAPEERIRTWVDTRRHLARNVLGILKSSMGGSLSLLDDESGLHPSAIDDAIGWFEDFRDFFLTDMQSRFQQAVDWLKKAEDSRVVDLVSKVTKILANNLPGGGEKKTTAIAVILQLNFLEQDIASLVQSYRDVLRSTRDSWIANILKREEKFLDNFSEFLDLIQQEVSNEPVDEDEDIDEDDEDDIAQLQRSVTQRRKKAYNEYSKAMNRWARALYSGKKLSPSSKTAKIVGWLGDRLPLENELFELGAKLAIQTRLRLLANPAKLYLEHIPSRYLSFRRVRVTEGVWYLDIPSMESMIKNRVVNAFELDILVLLMLRHAGELLGRLRSDELGKSKYSILQNIQSEYRHQVLVDEATDFSAVQLACMMELSHPQIRSFFACGDLLQRVTRHGVRSNEQIEWISKQIEFRTVAIAYRQSHRLTDLARSIALLGGGVADSVISPPDYKNNEGELPILAENIVDKPLAAWLGSRICEVEQRIGKVPSIAIFVDAESAVEPLTKNLSEALQRQNIQVVSCPQGKVMGHDGAVRVFDVQHIKGLEFEAVFFVGADILADREPDIFTKFLYVGATRAATYFGITCQGRLPSLMEGLREKFGKSWIKVG